MEADVLRQLSEVPVELGGGTVVDSQKTAREPLRQAALLRLARERDQVLEDVHDSAFAAELRHLVRVGAVEREHQVVARVGGAYPVVELDVELARGRLLAVHRHRERLDARLVDQDADLHAVLEQRAHGGAHRLEQELVHVEAVLRMEQALAALRCRTGCAGSPRCPARRPTIATLPRVAVEARREAPAPAEEAPLRISHCPSSPTHPPMVTVGIPPRPSRRSRRRRSCAAPAAAHRARSRFRSGRAWRADARSSRARRSACRPRRRRAGRR